MLCAICNRHPFARRHAKRGGLTRVGAEGARGSAPCRRTRGGRGGPRLSGLEGSGAATAIGGARCIRFGRLCAVVAGMQKLSTAGGDEGSVALPAAGRGRSCASIFGGFVRI